MNKDTFLAQFDLEHFFFLISKFLFYFKNIQIKSKVNLLVTII